MAFEIKVVLICGLLVLSGFQIDAKKTASKSKSGSSSSNSRPRPSPSTAGSSHADAARLSYSGYNAPPKIAPKASAPVQSAPPPAPANNANQRPVGWNVDNNAGAAKPNSAPYPTNNQGPPAYNPNANQQSGFQNTHQNPPPYSAGAPPAYPGMHNNPVQSGGQPPSYQQGGYQPNHQQGVNQQPAYGGQQPAYGGQQPAYGGQQPNYAQQPAYGGQQPNYAPQPAFGGQQPGYGQQPNYGGYGQQPIVNNYNTRGSSGGSGLQTALIAGVGGLALYGALKPSGGETTIVKYIYQNGTEAAGPSNETTAVTLPPTIAAEVMPINGSMPAPMPVVDANGNPIAPIVPGANVTEISGPTTEMLALSTINGTTLVSDPTMLPSSSPGALPVDSSTPTSTTVLMNVPALPDSSLTSRMNENIVEQKNSSTNLAAPQTQDTNKENSASFLSFTSTLVIASLLSALMV